MKRFSLLFSFVIPIFVLVALFNTFTPPVHAVEVSGIITSDTTWTVANSPYMVTDSLDIQAGVTLTIEAGVEVHAENNASLDVNGHLVVGDEAIAITSIISGFRLSIFRRVAQPISITLRSMGSVMTPLASVRNRTIQLRLKTQ